MKNIIRLVKNDVFVNYSFMTALQAINAFIYLLVYPVVITALGVTQYGYYIFATTICLYFSLIIQYGFDLPSIKYLADNKSITESESEAVSNVVYSRFILFSFSFLLFFIFYEALDLDSIYLICFLTPLSAVFNLNWFYQYKQNMKVTVLIDVISKAVVMLAIYLTIQNEGDTRLFALLMNVSNASSVCMSFMFAIFSYKLKIKPLSFSKVKNLLIISTPFFFSNGINTFKQKSIEVMIGVGVGFDGLAIYDLANKIYSIPALFATNINAALLPKFISSITKNVYKKIVLYEIAFSFFMIALVYMFGDDLARYLGAGALNAAYELSVLLSVNIFNFLVVGSIIYFVFIPHGATKLIAYNQLIATIFFLCMSIVMFLYDKSVYAIVISLILSGFVELLFCCYQARKFWWGK